MLKQQNNIVWSLISLNNAHAMSWKVHCFIQQYLLFALNEAICQFLSKFDIYPISIWRNFFQFEFVRKFVYSIFYYLISTGLYEQNFLCYRSHIGSSLKVPGLTHCGGGALRGNPGSAKMWKWSKSDENSGKFRQNCTFHENNFIFCLSEKIIFFKVDTMTYFDDSTI